MSLAYIMVKFTRPTSTLVGDWASTAETPGNVTGAALGP